ncbi:MAG: hypothetical protein RLZ51_1876 [Pseudomonadota bacterium]|jgi:hypothetical protein
MTEEEPTKLDEEIGGALRDWHDFESTPRKIIARRIATQRMHQNEAAAMRAAKALLDEGVISILTRMTYSALGRPTITYIAERVK